MAQIKAAFYVPLADNDGRDLGAEIDDLERRLYSLFFGWTFLGYVKGAYRMADDTRAVDETAYYAVVLDEARLPELEHALREFKGKTQQEAIYLEILWDIEVRFL